MVNSMAKFHFKYGAMNSGKSTALINAAYNYEERGLKVAVIKPSVDTKGSKMIVARAGLERKVDALITPTMNLRDAIHKISDKKGELNCVLVDEAQFLQPAQIDQLFEVAKFDKISVIAYGLRADFRRQMFPGSQRLFELVDHIEKLPTMCGCGSQAEFNTRKVNGVYVFDGDQVAIDGADSVTYDSLCGACYLAEQAKAAML